MDPNFFDELFKAGVLGVRIGLFFGNGIIKLLQSFHRPPDQQQRMDQDRRKLNGEQHRWRSSRANEARRDNE